jgi:hypothetical protein
VKFRHSIFLALAVIVLLAGAQTGRAQSSDPNLPTPVLTNEINASIGALDVGDSRLTRHYYAFEATPGDLIITVNSRNLNGDVDIFTAVTFRPLTKITIYANTIPPEVTKSLYFRTRQILILRLEARTPNDDAGTYRITFGGTFQTFTGGIAVAQDIESSEANTASDRRGRRLSSVGATIPLPPEEVKTEETKPPETVVESPKEETVAKKPASKPRSTRTTPRPTARNRGRTRPPAKEKPKESTGQETATSETEKPKPSEEKPANVEGEEKTGETTVANPAPQTPAGPHLIIERNDGTRIDRQMSAVRRVIVDSGVIVVVLKNGRIERVPMSTVVRMAIEP